MNCNTTHYRANSSSVPGDPTHDLGQEGDTPARVVDPWDVDDIAAGLFSVLTDEALRADLAARGQAHAMERTWLAVAQKHRQLWRSL